MQIILETNRLRLREFTLRDTNFIIELLNSPGWLQFIGERNVRTEEQAIAYLQNGPFKSYRENGFGLSMVELCEGNVPIGMAGMLVREYLDYPDIGFAFLPSFEGKGYAFEITQALIVHAAASWKMHRLLAITVPTNSRSIQLLVRNGFELEKPITLPTTGEELLQYKRELTVSEAS